MFRRFLPDLYLDAVADLTVQELQQAGIRGLICDIDNTLVTYDDPVPTPSAEAFFRRMAEAGIAVALVSNNGWERVRQFNGTWKCFASAKSNKPFGKQLRRAMEAMGTDGASTAVLGDQIFTDVYAGKRLGLRAYLVKPIRDKRSLFFRCKRKLEIPVLKKYAKLHGEAYRPNV